MKNKIGLFSMILGGAMFLGALALFLYNYAEALKAEQSANYILSQMIEQMPEPKREILPLEDPSHEEIEMSEIIIDDYAYIGYLSVPTLKLELPVMSDWDYKRLKVAPCRYKGCVSGDNMVLMAHNYERHFGQLSELIEGDQIIFTDMDGVVTVYQVVERDVLIPTAVEEMISGDFDLTLFTCTYGGKSRIAVYCNR